MIKKIFNAAIGISLLFGMSTIYAQIPIQQVPAQVNNMEFPYAPGQYTWPYAGGQLILVSGRYTNQVSWDVRSYMFYFKNKEDLFLVPIENPNKKNPFEWITYTTKNGAEWLMDDLAVKQLKNKIFLINASQASSDGYAEAGDITIDYYELKEATSEDIPYVFKLIKTKKTKKALRISIDEVIKKEFSNFK